jgi:hypothetical protein
MPDFEPTSEVIYLLFPFLIMSFLTDHDPFLFFAKYNACSLC